MQPCWNEAKARAQGTKSRLKAHDGQVDNVETLRSVQSVNGASQGLRNGVSQELQVEAYMCVVSGKQHHSNISSSLFFFKLCSPGEDKGMFHVRLLQIVCEEQQMKKPQKKQLRQLVSRRSEVNEAQHSKFRASKRVAFLKPIFCFNFRTYFFDS